MFSDGWGAYGPVDKKFLAHCKANHSKEFVNYKEIVILPEREVESEIKIGEVNFLAIFKI